MRAQFIVCGLAVVLTAAEARATEDINVYYRAGNDAFAKKDWNAAEAAYEKAWAIKHTFDVAANLGEVELHVSPPKPRRAAELLDYSVRNAPPSTKPENLERSKKFLASAKAQVETLHLRANASGASFYVDGAALSSDAGDLFLDPGRHNVEARAPGFSAESKTVEARAGGDDSIVFQLNTETTERRSWVPGGLLVGAGAIALGLGVGFKIAGGSAGSSADDQLAQLQSTTGRTVVCPASPECGAIHDQRAAHDRDANIGTGLLIGGGVAVAAGIVYLLWPASRTSTPSAHFVVTPGGIAALGSF